MQVQINTDRNIEGHEALAAQVTSVVESALSRSSDLRLARHAQSRHERHDSESAPQDRHAVEELGRT